jgi:hypothetical protein
LYGIVEGKFHAFKKRLTFNSAWPKGEIFYLLEIANIKIIPSQRDLT